MADLLCLECGADVFVSNEDTAHHWGTGPDNIDHDADADHVAVPDGPTCPECDAPLTHEGASCPNQWLSAHH